MFNSLIESQTDCGDDPLIVLKEIRKAFGSSLVLDGIDLTIHRGEAVAIIGPSGTGKSTILRIIAGLLAPDSGEIYVQGKLRVGLIEDAPRSDWNWHGVPASSVV